MATTLKKNLVRESTEKVDDKEIMITLTEDQDIELKLKGQRGDGKTIGIADLYAQLYDVGGPVNTEGPIQVKTKKVKRGDNRLISLHDLRSVNAISMLDLETKAKFDQIINNLVKSYK